LIVSKTKKDASATVGLSIRDRPIWHFWGRCRHIGHSWTDSR